MTARLRPELAELPAYVEGKTVTGAIKLASNETVTVRCPASGGHRARDEMVNRYPDNHNAELKSRLAQHLNPPAGARRSPGAHRRRRRLGESVPAARPGHTSAGRRGALRLAQLRDVPVAGAGRRRHPVEVPLRDETFDLYAMLAAVTDRTRLIFVCNPNNPTSTVVDPRGAGPVRRAVPSHILIAIDEAYVEYIRDSMLPDSLGLVRSYSNVVVLRTFSKAYGLAGLRVGYAVGDPQVITALNKVAVPFTTTNVSQAAAIASLDAADELLARTDAVVAERTRVSDTLRGAGFTVPPSQANFVWLPLGTRTLDFVEQAADARIVVRPYGTDGVRVTIGAPEENNALLQFARAGFDRRRSR